MLGTRWTAAQGVINKVVTAVAMLILARLLTPDEFGMASVVVVASGFVTILPVFVMGDVLITHQHHLATVSQAARRVMLWTTVGLVIAIVATAPIIALVYSQYPFWPVATLLAICALRPIAEALTVMPLARLRIALQYREVALITGFIQFGATVLTVIWAVLWPGAAAIVLPQVIAVIARAIFFEIAARRLARTHAHRTDRPLERRRPDLPQRVARRIAGEFSVASLAQYVHTVVSGLPLMVTALLVDETTTGFFSFAYTLAIQTTGVIAAQLAVVLQPIFGRLKTDPSRQIGGFVRIVAAMAALTVPLSLVQAALAEPLFKLFFGSKWMPVIPMFIAFSLVQAFCFILAPTLALLKAQGRFTTVFIWQVVQGLVCLVLFPTAAMLWGALGVAWMDVTIWAVSMPFVVWLGSRSAGVGMLAVLRAFFMPWATSLPIAAAIWFSWWLLPAPGLIAAGAWLLIAGPIGMLLAVLSTRVTQPAVAREFAPFMRRALVRLPLLGKPLAEWYTPRDDEWL